VELNDSTAVSWKHGDRYVTLIGVKTLSEVDRIVAWLDNNKPYRADTLPAEIKASAGNSKQLK
jgi:hypothetical protein